MINIYQSLSSYTDNIDIYDPWVESEEAEKEYGVKIIREFDKIGDKKYDAVVLCVAHSKFKEIDLKSITYENSTIYDVKSAFDRNIVTQRL